MTKKFGRGNVESDVRAARVLLGYSSTPSGVVDHGSLLGLSDDDHPQYAHRQQNETISGQYSFSPASSQPPFVLGANAQGQLVTGLRADELSKTITAGNGLTGGGTLTGNLSLAVNLGSPSGLTFSGTALVVDDALAGAGLTISSKVLAVGAGNGITVNANDVALTTPGTLTVSSSNSATGNHTHAITSSSNPGAAASLLASNASGYLQLNRIGLGVAPSYPLHARLTTEQMRLDYDASNYASFTVSSGGNLTLAPTGDLVLNPTGNDILPLTSYDLNLGSLTKRYLTLHAAELWVQTLVAQNTVATFGGRILVAPSNELIADVSTSDTTISVKYNNLTNGDRLYLEANGQVEWMAVTGNPADIAGGYQYSVTRNLDGTGANLWNAGDSLVNTGQAGNGFIDLYSQRSVSALNLDYIFVDDGGVFSSNLAESAYFALYPATGVANDALYLGRTGAGWSNLSVFFYLGTAGSVSATFVYEYWNGAAWTSFVPSPSPSFNSTGQHDLGVGALAGEATTSVNGQTAYWIRRRVSGVLSWTTSPVQAGRKVTCGEAQWGPTIVGWVRNSSTYNDITEHWAIGNLNGLYGYGADTPGVGLGKYGTGSENYVTVDGTNGVRFFTGNAVQAQLTGSTWTMGSVSGGEYVKITSSAIELYGNAVKTIDLRSNGDVYLGNSGGARLFYDESASTLDFLNSGGTSMLLMDGVNEYLEVGLPRAVRISEHGVYVDTDQGKLMVGPTFATSGAYGEIYGSLSSSGQYHGYYQIPAKTGTDAGYYNQLDILAGGHTGANVSSAVTFRLFSQADGTEYFDWLLATSSLMRLTDAGILFLGDTANANMTSGLTINQGGADDQLFALKSSDVAHGITTLVETDTFGAMQKQAATTGGLRVTGYTEDDIGVGIYGIFTTDDTARATTANGGVIIRASKKSGTTEGAPGANANLLVVKSASNARFIVDQEGDIHMDATSNINAWDEHNDIALLAGVREAMNPALRFDEFVEDARPVLERTGVVRYNPDGHHFVSLKKLHALEIDAMRQLYQRIETLEARLATYENQTP